MRRRAQDRQTSLWDTLRPPLSRTGGCPYWQQYQSVGTWVAAAELLFNPLFVQPSEVLVVDDADLPWSLAERIDLDLDALERAKEQLKGKRWHRIRQILTIVSHALVDVPRHENGPGGRAMLGPAVWDHLVGTPCRYRVDPPALIGALPESLKLPTPKAKGKKVSRQIT